ncbi:MAG: superoxide dismutase [Bacteroidia bacterium]|nr:superoxide dismutase [Bacteroidia bacterium]MCZ2140084.1 superoxide dismutase [Bacteroidia bacterium]
MVNTNVLQAAVKKVNQVSGNEFVLPDLEYSYEALEPHIDATTMRIHHTKHHQAYITNLNNAIAKETSLKGKTLEQLITNINSLPETVKSAIRNNGGGHWNHSFFWQIMNPGSKMSKKTETALIQNFGSVDEFKKQFEKAGLTQFGSGWAWLIKQNNKLLVTATPNQDNPLMDIAAVKGTPILGIDVWEHAYYLKYQNKRNDYLQAFWNVVNWEKVDALING